MRYLSCPICGHPAEKNELIPGRVTPKDFSLYHCPRCRMSFIGDPVRDPARLYTEAYYRGQGADPRADYFYELEHPEETVRQYEWRGVTRLVQSLTALSPGSRWLDYGCGNGCLVRYVSERGIADIRGFEEGAIVPHAKARGIPVLNRAELDGVQEKFDVVTAIEVLEHVPDPLTVLRHIRQLLKQNGIFFFTTGNARPFRGRIAQWSYCIPDIHVSFFEPETMRYALEKTGFRAEGSRWLPGWTDIIRFKVLKGLGIRKQQQGERLLPWNLLSRLADLRYGISRQPIGRAQ